MKILLYSSFFKIFGGRNVGGGLLSALENQKKTLEHLSIPFTEKIDDDWNVIQINIPWPGSIRLAKKAKAHGKKVVMWSHVTVEDLEKSVRLFAIIPGAKFLTKKYLTRVYNQADLVLCPSEYTKGILISYGLPKERLSVQSNAVDTKKFYKDPVRREDYRKKYKLEGLVVGNVGLVIHRKGIDTFLKLTRKFPQNQFVWFGKIFSKILVQRISTEAPSNMKFTGYVLDSVAAMNALDIFLFPSYEENQGMVVLEACAVGLPILVRDIPVYNGWLVHGVNCLKAKNEQEFKDCLKELVNNQSLREKLVLGALQLAGKESIETQGEILRKTYQKLLTV